jgi:hypothetical protein
MTDARFPERWLNDRRLLRLSDAAFRLFAVSLTWSVSNRTDGELDASDLALMPGIDPTAAGELVKAGLWMAGGSPSPTAAPWLIIEFASTQTSSSELQILTNARRREREKKRRQRARLLGDVPGEVSPGTAPDRPGQARPGTKTEGQVHWLPAEFSENAPDVRGAEGDAAGGNGHPPTPSQTRKRVHDGTNPDGPDVQHFSIEVHPQSQATDRNAREACPVCGVRQRLRTNGKLARHGPKTTPCRGSGMTPTGTAP